MCDVEHEWVQHQFCVIVTCDCDVHASICIQITITITVAPYEQFHKIACKKWQSHSE